MKQIIISLLTLLALVGCSDQEEKAVIRGKVNNLDIEKVTFYHMVKNAISPSINNYEVIVNESGEFEVEIPLMGVAYGYLKYGKEMQAIVLIDGDKFFIHIDTDTISYSGRGAGKNSFLLATKEKGLDAKAMYDLANSKDLSLEDYLVEIEDFRSERFQFLDSFSQQEKISDAFVMFYRGRTKAILDYKMLLYPKKYARRNNFDLDSIDIPMAYLEKAELPNMIDDDKAANSHYLRVLNNEIKVIANEKYEAKNSKEKFDAFTKTVVDTLTGRTRDYMLAYHIKRRLSIYPRYDTLAIQTFNDIAEDELAQKIVESAIKTFQIRQSLIGQPLPEEFTSTLLIDTAGNEITFGEMIAKYRGRAVYLDIWSVGCGPCQWEMKRAKGLKKRLNDRAIEFVYISTSKSDAEQWPHIFQLSNTRDNHYIFKNEFDAKLLVFMEILAAPNYMMFDKREQLFDYMASRPSHSETEATLIKLSED